MRSQRRAESHGRSRQERHYGGQVSGGTRGLCPVLRVKQEGPRRGQELDDRPDLLEGLTEGLYYELKPLGIELRLIEQGGSRGNNFRDSIVFNTHPEITDYDAIAGKVNAMFASLEDAALDDPQDIVDEIHALATGKNRKFRTLVGQAGTNDGAIILIQELETQGKRL